MPRELSCRQPGQTWAPPPGLLLTSEQLGQSLILLTVDSEFTLRGFSDNGMTYDTCVPGCKLDTQGD